MSERYDPQEIEPKWQARWRESDLYRTRDDAARPKFYGLEFFPYPSGDGLSVGHCRNYIPTDVICRYKRMCGFDVLHPMGWDAFGLPAENEAIKQKSHPSKTVPKYVANYKRQFDRVGMSYDWSREINSSSPDYYRWTQWIFLLLYKRGLAYRSDAPVNWCPSCGTVLANEEVEAGLCWRCSTSVEKRELPQWFFRITAYADRLLLDLDTVDWPDSIKAMQRNWIGRSEGVEFELKIDGHETSIHVFTTRVDTVFGVSFAVLAPEHPIVKQITTEERRAEVEEYVRKASLETEIERLSTERERTGVFTGAYAINPMGGEKVPIFVADYVLLTYGTGAIMAVPAHDARDFDFAKRYGLPVKVVIAPPGVEGPVSGEEMSGAYVEAGTMVNSGQFDGLPSPEGARKIAEFMEANGIGRTRVHYKLRDWLISRQRYWGVPIPIVYCRTCGEVPVPEEKLPVELPYVEQYEPSGTGKSPLATIPEFVNTICPACGGPAERETDTMGGFACSSWYFLRYANPHYQEGPFDREAVEYWLPVDLYVGGAEHAVMHLLYARFWTKALHDAGMISFAEPFQALRNQGMLLAPDPKNPGVWIKMSKSKGNVVTPDEVVARYGADSLRVYELFVAPLTDSIQWSEDGINGMHRFLSRAYRVVQEYGGHYDPRWREAGRQEMMERSEDRALARKTHQTIRKVTEDIEGLQFNTAVAALMELMNELWKHAPILRQGVRSAAFSEAVEMVVLLLAPMAPHLADELWEQLGHDGFTALQPWPEYDPDVARADEITVVLQINGKLRDRLSVPPGTPKEDLKAQALASEKIQSYLEGKSIRQVIVVPDRLVNIVVG
ncbi:MAG TPA: leucine--tRNA ligase [Armatimonadota bacterium]|nr:leucine--tRNA ligase [Armatimonadota bacterium]